MIASALPSRMIFEPGFGDLLARTCASTRCSSSTRSTNTSSLPPDSFCPNMRAGITLVLLKINRSFSLTSDKISLNTLCSTWPDGPSSVSKRLLVRSALGKRAINSSGRSKLKSATRIEHISH